MKSATNKELQLQNGLSWSEHGLWNLSTPESEVLERETYLLDMQYPKAPLLGLRVSLR